MLYPKLKHKRFNECIQGMELPVIFVTLKSKNWKYIANPNLKVGNSVGGKEDWRSSESAIFIHIFIIYSIEQYKFVSQLIACSF